MNEIKEIKEKINSSSRKREEEKQNPNVPEIKIKGDKIEMKVNRKKKKTCGRESEDQNKEKKLSKQHIHTCTKIKH